MRASLRIFISSPGDVPAERLRAALVIDKLTQDYSRFFELEAYRWESEPMLASGHFQDLVVPPSSHDIVIVIVWSRLGTPLPEKTAVREYHGADGRVPVTGTEWEFEDALAAAQQRGVPDILAFRNTTPVPVDTQDLTVQARSLAQLSALNGFWSRHFADRGVFLAAYESYRTIEEFAQNLERSLRKLIERRIKTLDGFTSDEGPSWTTSPFRGLEAYEFEHAAIYFGRDSLVAKAIEALATRARAGSAFLLMSGASGSGKSSLVKAAIVPRLMKPQRVEGIAFARRLAFRPSDGGADIILGLITALTQANGDGIGLPELLAPGQSAKDLAEHLGQTPDGAGFLFAAALGRVSEAERNAGRMLAIETAKLILVIDQFEEIFTVDSISDADRQVFVRLLAVLARSGAAWVITTIRADFWHRAAEIPDLAALSEGTGRFDVAAPSPAELTEMIRRPAEAAGLSFEEHPDRRLRLDAVIAEEAMSAPGVLPLLSFTLEALYTEDVTKHGSRVLSYATYEALGGLAGAIATRAEETVAGLSPTAQDALPRVLRSLATVASSADQAAVARAAPLESFAPGSAARSVVDAFTAARLLVASNEGAVPTVRLAHEALLRNWDRARLQLVADRRDLETRVLIEGQQLRWQVAAARHQRHLLLLRNPDLPLAADLASRWGDELPPKLRGYITESIAAARAATWRRRAIVAVVMVCLAVFAMASFGALVTAKRQDDDALIAQSRFLARDSRSATRNGYGTLSIILSLAALPRNIAAPDRPFINEAEYALEEAVAMRRELATLRGHNGPVEDVAFSPHGDRLVTAGRDDTARIWDAKTGAPLAVLKGHTDWLWSAGFSPDGRRIVTASSDKTARLWDAATGRSIATLTAHEDAVTIAVFSSDGHRILTASDDGTARVWNGESGAPVALLKGHTGAVLDAQFSPDGSLVVTASTDKTAKIWKTDTGELLRTLSGHLDFVSSAIFSPDGKRVVTASWDGTARVWNVATGEPTLLNRSHEGRVWYATFSPDGQRIATASEDKTAGLWNAANGHLIALLGGHEGWVNVAMFSADGKLIVTASDDDTARLWDAETGAPLGVLGGHTGSVNWASFSPDGTEIATASDDGVPMLWSTETAATAGILMGHDGPVNFVQFSPDGSVISTASLDDTARIWDAKTGAVRHVLKGHTDTVWTARFSADGKQVVTSSDDKTARIWDVATGAQIGRPFQHPDRIIYAAFSPNGKRMVTGGDDKLGRVWDVTTGKELFDLKGHEDWVSAAEYSPDGKRIVTASYDKTARVWNAETGAQVLVLSGHKLRLNGAVFSLDGERIATSSMDRTARVWDAATGSLIAEMTGDTDWIISVDFSADGKRVLTSSWDGTARIWDAGTGAPILALRGHRERVTFAAFSPDNTKAASASYDRTVRLWRLPPHCQALINAASGDVTRPANDQEQAQYFLSATHPSTAVLSIFTRWFAPLLPRAGDPCG